MFSEIFTWVTTNWGAIMGVATGVAALIQSFQTRKQTQANTAVIQAHVANTDVHTK